MCWAQKSSLCLWESSEKRTKATKKGQVNCTFFFPIFLATLCRSQDLSSPQSLLPSRLPYDIEQSSMCYTVGPCWLSILNTAACTWPYVFTSWGSVPKRRIAGSYDNLCLLFAELPASVPKQLYYFTIPPAMYERSVLFISSSTLVIWVFDSSHPHGCEVELFNRMGCILLDIGIYAFMYPFNY